MPWRPNTEALRHPKLVMRVTRRGRIRVNTYDGQTKDYEPVFTERTYTGLKEALADIVEWYNAQPKTKDGP